MDPTNEAAKTLKAATVFWYCTLALILSAGTLIATNPDALRPIADFLAAIAQAETGQAAAKTASFVRVLGGIAALIVLLWAVARHLSTRRPPPLLTTSTHHQSAFAWSAICSALAFAVAGYGLLVAAVTRAPDPALWFEAAATAMVLLQKPNEKAFAPNLPTKENP